MTVAARIAVFGSLNHDIVLSVPHMPASDETLRATNYAEFCGGKGFNQAVAAARLGASSAMVGCIGNDGAGALLRSTLDRNHVNHQYVIAVEAHTGTAVITTDANDVTIVIVAGANGVVNESHAEDARAILENVDVLLLQGEISHHAAARAAQIVREAGGTVVFSPAPVHPDSALVVPHATYIIANRGEAAALGLVPSNTVIITEGAAGARVGDIVVPIFPATVVDPTGAGDSFTAAFAVAIAEGKDVVDAVRFGCAAGSWAVRIRGAEPSLPTRTQVDAVLLGA